MAKSSKSTGKKGKNNKWKEKEKKSTQKSYFEFGSFFQWNKLKLQIIFKEQFSKYPNLEWSRSCKE